MLSRHPEDPHPKVPCFHPDPQTDTSTILTPPLSARVFGNKKEKMSSEDEGGMVVGGDDKGVGHDYNYIMREQDRFLPIANINRIMKRALPDNAKVAKDAKETIQECVSEFICFITSEASDRCQQEKRKTINGEDILWAMQSLGFENYCDPLKIYLNKYRESVKGDKGSAKTKEEPDSEIPQQMDNVYNQSLFS